MFSLYLFHLYAVFLEHFENVTISLFWLQKLIYYPKDLENVLNERFALVHEKTCGELFTNIKNGNTSHENPYFSECDGGTWKQ